jgi:type IV secretory pathway VirB2 component (pilin)
MGKGDCLVTTNNGQTVHIHLHAAFRSRLALLLAILSPGSPLYAQSPWENAVNQLQLSFTGPIAKGLSLVAIVVGGLMFAFGEGESKRMLAGIIFGIGMALGAVAFMGWLFPG